MDKYAKYFISNDEKSSFLENINLLLTTGVSTSNTLKSIKEGEKSPQMKTIIEKMISDVNEGLSLSKSINNSKLFPEYVIELIELGEKTGTLSKTLDLLIDERSKSEDLRQKTTSAMLYPSIILSVSLIVALLISWLMLPKLATIFTSLHIKLPLITKIILGFGAFLSKYGSIFVPLFIIFIYFIVYFLFINNKTKRYGQNILFKLPGIGNLLSQTEISRFGYLLSSLLSVGIPAVSAIKTIANATPVYKYKKFYDFLTYSLTEGNSFEKTFALYKNSNELFPTAVQTLIISGEKSSKLESVLKILDEKYSKKTETSARNLSIILEPIFLVIVWGVVVAIALAVIMPIYSLTGNINR